MNIIENGNLVGKHTISLPEKIVDIIEADGRKAEYRILDNVEFRNELNKKLQED